MKKLSIALILMTAWIYYSSCSKNDDLQNPDPNTIDSVDIMGFKDSTLLMKSLHRVDYNEDGTFKDSSTAYITYDTVNRKIIITDGMGNEIEEHTYNNKGLLVHLEVKDDHGTYTMDYTYDESDILKSVTESGGPEEDNEKYILSKTVLPSGKYQLKWEVPDSFNPNRDEYIIANFDSERGILSYYDYTNDKLFISDSIVYDAEGSISKVIRTQWNVSQPFTQFDFIGRDTKGEQLYNFYRILYNGISNFPDLYSGFSGPFNETFFQFFKYPALATDITNPDGNSFKTVRFSDTPQYDSKNRLIRYRNFFNDDQLYVTEYTISYYK